MQRHISTLAERPSRPLHSELYRAATDYLNRCFADETPPRVKELATILEMPVPRLSKRFDVETGSCISDFLRRAQIERAQLLLTYTGLSMNQIAYRAGFGTRMSFFRAFKRCVGMTPAEYRGRACNKCY